MTKEQIQGIVRHAMTALGGVLVAISPAITSGLWDTVIGSAVALAGVVWSIVKNS